MWVDAGFAENYSDIDISDYLFLKADYPETVKRPDDKMDRSWLDEFLKQSISCFLSGRGGANSIYSPISVYFSLGIMAELEDGEMREEILELLGAKNIEELRKNSYDIWNANYTLTNNFANSLWLNEGTEIDEETLQILRDSYYASVYKGDFSSEECALAYRAWLNENTDGLVDKLSDVNLDPDAYMAHASAIKFSAHWKHKFFDEKNDTKIFHTPNGEVEAEFMNQDIGGRDYYWGNNFSSVKLDFIYGDGMFFILPDENTSIDELLSDDEFLSFVINSGDWKNKSYPKVNLSVPKFEIQSDMELTQGLKSLGLDTVNIKIDTIYQF
jgi:serine protease inhibitor